MEKRSHRRIRDLDVLTAFRGLVANEIGCARISMMASEQETLPQWAEYRCARPIISRSSHAACTARPVHTEVHGQAMWTAVPGMAHLPAEQRTGHRRHGPVRCPDLWPYAALCSGHHPTGPTRSRLDQRHTSSDRGLDRAPDHRGIPLE